MKRALATLAAGALVAATSASGGPSYGITGSMSGVPAKSTGLRLGSVVAVRLASGAPAAWATITGPPRYRLSLGRGAYVLLGDVSDSKGAYSGANRPFEALHAARVDVAARSSKRFLAGSSRASAAGGVVLMPREIPWTRSFGVDRSGLKAVVETELSVAAEHGPCAAQVSALGDPRVVEARKVEMELQSKGLTQTHTDFSKTAQPTHDVTGSARDGADGSVNGTLTLRNLKTGERRRVVLRHDRRRASSDRCSGPRRSSSRTPANPTGRRTTTRCCTHRCRPPRAQPERTVFAARSEAPSPSTHRARAARRCR